MDTSGEYILPVPFSPVQTQLLDAVIMSHYSELLGYFSDEENPNQLRAERALVSLRKMSENIELMCFHPALLIHHYLPANLLNKSTPQSLVQSSGIFEVLAMLVRATAELDLNIAVVSRQGKTADLLEAFFVDKPVNYYRYSGKPLKDPKPKKARATTFYLIPSSIDYLTAAVHAAFDFMIVVDSSFDLGSDYATGLRSQLRDPGVRKPLCSVVMLCPLNTIVHAGLSQDSDPASRLGAAVAARHHAGEIPPEIQSVFDYGLVPLSSWFKAADSPWPLPRLNQMPKYQRKDVYEQLMQTPKIALPTPQKVKRLKTEDSQEVESLDDFFNYSELARDLDSIKKEADSLRQTATSRENELEDVKENLAKLLYEQKTQKVQREANEQKVHRYKAELEDLRKNDAERKAEVEKWVGGLEGDKKEYAQVVQELQQAKEENEKLSSRLKSQETNLEYLKVEFNKATASVAELNNTITELQKVEADLKEKAEGQYVKFREMALNRQLEAKENELATLRAELDNLKAAVAVADSERAYGSRDRTRAVRGGSGSRSRTPTSVPSPH